MTSDETDLYRRIATDRIVMCDTALATVVHAFGDRVPPQIEALAGPLRRTRSAIADGVESGLWPAVHELGALAETGAIELVRYVTLVSRTRPSPNTLVH